MKKTVEHAGSMLSEDKGFYIILFLCILAIGISGYVLFFTPSKAASETLDPAIYVPSVAATEDIAPVLEETPKEEEEAPAEESSMTETTQATAAVEAETVPSAVQTPIYVRPIAGKLSMAFSGDELVYQETLGDWRTHTGADYAAQAGDRVYAMADGTVKDVWLDALYGYCVALEHSNSLQTYYKGLHDTVKVKVGDSVKAGDILGTVGLDNQTEGAAGVHLHVEAMRDGERINPESLLTDA